MNALILLAMKALAPVIISQVPYVPDSCASNDPLGPCVGSHMILQNRIDKAVEIKISCGEDEAIVQMGRNQMLSLDIELEIPPTGSQPCHITHWEIIK